MFATRFGPLPWNSERLAYPALPTPATKKSASGHRRKPEQNPVRRPQTPRAPCSHILKTQPAKRKGIAKQTYPKQRWGHLPKRVCPLHTWARSAGYTLEPRAKSDKIMTRGLSKNGYYKISNKFCASPSINYLILFGVVFRYADTQDVTRSCVRLSHASNVQASHRPASAIGTKFGGVLRKLPCVSSGHNMCHHMPKFGPALRKLGTQNVPSQCAHKLGT